MLTESQVQEKISSYLFAFNSAYKIKEIKQIAPDMSLRRYFRVSLENNQTLIAMHIDSATSPEAGGITQVSSDQAFVELGIFFEKNKVAVPKIITYDLEKSLIFVEDLGDLQLFSVIKNADSSKTEKLFKAAIDQILLIQKIPADKAFFPFCRSFTEKQYYTEMQELLDLSLREFNLKQTELNILDRFYNSLALELAQLPQVLVHRDFHAWNLILQNDKVRVIDFQDALMATQSYDLVSLLNDRDIDSILGEVLYKNLVHYFFDNTVENREVFFEHYDLVLLQRDLKVSGRFFKISKLRGIKSYEQWIPGTLRRVGATLERILSYQANKKYYRDVLDILSTYYADVKSGSERKFRIK